MDNRKIGRRIYPLRKEKNFTQWQVAEQMHISDKTVSKWERGLGCPEVSLLPELSKLFDVDLEKFLSGELEDNNVVGGNMNNLCFFICPNCKNVITAMGETNVTCCGKKLKPLQPKKAPESDRLQVETVENDFFIHSRHPMTREHYISFVALLTVDTLLLRKQYPQWDLQVRLPILSRGRLLWYCSRHGLFYQEIEPPRRPLS
ncbi:MAG: helix-turn-helix domain-containing protein [Peptoniphilus sp.]|nr:helix-turn-helix domain-containing protein [Peptoniphilus sp.]MDY3119113.1 helix-turn-helix domain-containing protein [Peptoniphilus sp.]